MTDQAVTFCRFPSTEEDRRQVLATASAAVAMHDAGHDVTTILAGCAIEQEWRPWLMAALTGQRELVPDLIVDAHDAATYFLEHLGRDGAENFVADRLAWCKSMAAWEFWSATFDILKGTQKSAEIFHLNSGKGDA